MNTIYFYRMFGTTFASQIEFPELNPAIDALSTDVYIEFGKLGIMSSSPTLRFEFSESEQLFVYPDVGAFLIQGTDRVLIEPLPGVPHNLIAFPFLGPVLALLLHLRGVFVLHGSAVSLNGVGFGFVGDKGAGKSTIAATLLGRSDTSLLSDDILAISNQLEIRSGFPQLKLSAEALEYASNIDGCLRPPPVPDFPKNQIRLNSSFSSDKIPVGGIYELRRGANLRVEDVSEAEALRILLRFSYIARFSKRKTLPKERQQTFEQVVRFASSGRIKRIFAPDTLKSLPKVGELLETIAKEFRR